MRNRVHALGVIAAAVAILLATAPPAVAASGDPDPTFGSSGHVGTDFAGHFDLADGVLVQGNGRIVAVGQVLTGSTFDDSDFGIARYLSNGDPDTSFSGDGRRTLDFTGLGDEATAAAQQHDGKVVAVGLSTVSSTSSDVAVARFTKGGAPDPAFSTDGKTRTAFPGFFSASADAVAVQGDGKIVVVGEAVSGAPHLGGGGGQSDIAVVRYKAGGALDTAFGGDGRVTTDFAGAFDVGRSVAILHSGDILVAGQSQTAADEQRIVVVEYRPNGTLDTSFSTDGKVVVNMSPGNAEDAVGVAVRGDGKIVVGASVRNAVSATSGADLGVLLLNANGSIATTFGGGDGMVFRDFGGTEDPDQMVRDTDGTLVFVATRPFVDASHPQAIWVFRLTPGGAKDTGFGSGGRAQLEFGTGGVGGFAVALDASHRPVVAGRVGIGDDADFAVARFQA
ncbi:MAG TPA: hypothetical protein VID47_02660 [Actinomycetota bacterium]